MLMLQALTADRRAKARPGLRRSGPPDKSIRSYQPPVPVPIRADNRSDLGKFLLGGGRSGGMRTFKTDRVLTYANKQNRRCCGIIRQRKTESAHATSRRPIAANADGRTTEHRTESRPSENRHINCSAEIQPVCFACPSRIRRSS